MIPWALPHPRVWALGCELPHLRREICAIVTFFKTQNYRLSFFYGRCVVSYNLLSSKTAFGDASARERVFPCGSQSTVDLPEQVARR